MLIGHLGKDPELRVLADGISVVSFPLVTAENITKNGASVERTEWHNIIMWGEVAEHAAKILKKGKLVFLEGKIHNRSFNDKSGIKKHITEIVTINFRLVGRSIDFEYSPLNFESSDKKIPG